MGSEMCIRDRHDSAKPHQKLDMYKSHDSHKSFKSYAKEAVDAEDTCSTFTISRLLKAISSKTLNGAGTRLVIFRWETIQDAKNRVRAKSTTEISSSTSTPADLKG